MENTNILTHTIDTLSQRIDSLESKLAFQDDLVDQLNKEVAIHQEQIAELSHQLRLVASRIKDMRTDSVVSQDIEPPPPHY